MNIKSLLLTAALAIPVVASAQSSTTSKDTSGTATGKTEKTEKTREKTSQLSNEEMDMVSHLHHVNMVEMDLGKAAKAHGTAAVKRYGTTLLADHKQNDKELTAMARKKGMMRIPAESAKTDAEKQEMKQQQDAIAALKKMKGADFDREFLRMMVEDHEKELAKAESMMSSASDADMKSYLESTRTMFRRHADDAKELQKNEPQATAVPKPPKKPTK